MHNNNNNELTRKICNRLSDYIMEGQLSNDDVVQIIEHAGQYLNICTRSVYSAKHGISYNGAKKHRHNVELFGIKFIIDNL